LRRRVAVSQPRPSTNKTSADGSGTELGGSEVGNASAPKPLALKTGLMSSGVDIWELMVFTSTSAHVLYVSA
jgi:hypothetical protein